MKLKKYSLIILAISIYLCSFIFNKINSDVSNILNYMFLFNSYEQLANENMEKLEMVCTNETLSKITINNKELLETVYYQFRNYKTSPILLTKRSSLFSSYAKFSIKNKMISDDRIFIIYLKTNLIGKVCDVKLIEILEHTI